MNHLRVFFENKELAETVKALFIEALETLSLEDLKNDVDARYLTKSIAGIERAYLMLEVEFNKAKEKETVNEAR